MAEKKIIAVVGATGARGGGPVRAIQRDESGPFRARALTRNASSESAQRLASLGAEIVEANIDDPQSVERAFNGAYGAQMAAALTRALGEEVRYQPYSPDEFRALGFPGADDLGNMFQFKGDFEADYCGARDVSFARELNPDLQTFGPWLAEHAKQIPVPQPA